MEKTEKKIEKYVYGNEEFVDILKLSKKDIDFDSFGSVWVKTDGKKIHIDIEREK